MVAAPLNDSPLRARFPVRMADLAITVPATVPNTSSPSAPTRIAVTVSVNPVTAVAALVRHARSLRDASATPTPLIALTQCQWDQVVETWNYRLTHAERAASCRACAMEQRHLWAIAPIGDRICLVCLRYEESP